MSRHYRRSLKGWIRVSEPKRAPNPNVCLIVRPHKTFAHKVVTAPIVFFINPMHISDVPALLKTSLHNQSFQ